MNFSSALTFLKEGKIVTRKGWNNPNISVGVQFPDEHSVNTEPYLYMAKKGDVNDSGKPPKRFPLDLSCESIFAEDWEIVA